MSLRGRYMIDRIKNLVSNHFRMPCPPYGDPTYWDAAYMSLGPQDKYEWGDITLDDVYQYSYHPIQYNVEKSISYASDQKLRTTLGDVLNAFPLNDEQNPQKARRQKQQPILMLGCGNSKFGEQMIERGWYGPIIQVDVSSRVIDSMSQRCSSFISNGHMNFIQDDATELSAFRDGMIDACLDKGLIDAIFCADEYEQLHKIMKSIGRVIKPGASFVFFSFSRPEFLLPHLLADQMKQDIRKRQWTDIDVQQLDKILLYKLQKVDSKEQEELRIRPNLYRKDKLRR